MKLNSIEELIKGTHNDIWHQDNTHQKKNPIDCDGVQLSNAKLHMASISILWYRKSRIIQMTYKFVTNLEMIILYEKALFNGCHLLYKTMRVCL